MYCRIVDRTQNIEVSSQGRVARGFFRRLAGYMFKAKFDQEEALIFYGAPCIHMFFMRAALDIIFLDKDNRVVGMRQDLRPWQLACCPSRVTLELPTGRIVAKGVRLNDTIDIIEGG